MAAATTSQLSCVSANNPQFHHHRRSLLCRTRRPQPNKYMALKKIHPNKYMLLKRLMLKGKKRRKKPNKYMLERLKEEENMMSKLPDDILVSIMCCLRTEEAARMSVVSRRWEKIWKTTIRITPRLNFNVNKGWSLSGSLSGKDCDLIKKDMRITEVYRVLKLLHKAPTLYEFSLLASQLEKHDSNHINAWMDCVAKKHVKKLILNLSSVTGYDASVVADNFHSLRELVMEGIDVTENFIHRLFSNSPFLERFSLKSSHALLSLSIVSAPNLNYLYIERCNRLQHLQISSSAYNLSTIEISGPVNFESVNISAPNLSHVILGIHDQGFKFDSYINLLNQIKRLTLTIEVYSDAISAGWFPQFPEFSKIEHLELRMDPYSKLPIHRLQDILKAVPFLNTFSLKDYKLIRHPAKDNALKWLGMHIPKEVEVNQNRSCQYLKMVKLDMFAGCQYEVEFFLHLLEYYAVSVEKIFIQLMSSSFWRDREYWRRWGRNYEDKFYYNYEEFCLGCAQLLKTKILQMHPRAEVIIT